MINGNFERFVAMIYRRWKNKVSAQNLQHPQEVDLAAFIEGKLDIEQEAHIRAHILRCQQCSACFAAMIKEPQEDKDVPANVLAGAQKLVQQSLGESILEIVVMLKDKALEIINCAGDILYGQEFIPAAVLRSRQIRDFAGSVSILKDFKQVRIKLTLETKIKDHVNIIVDVVDKDTHKAICDARVSLLRDDRELESRLSDTGRFIFERIVAASYKITVTPAGLPSEIILLDIGLK